MTGLTQGHHVAHRPGGQERGLPRAEPSHGSRAGSFLPPLAPGAPGLGPSISPALSWVFAPSVLQESPVGTLVIARQLPQITQEDVISRFTA